MFGLPGKTWGQVALALVGAFVFLIVVGVCVAAIGGTESPAERTEARPTAKAAPTATLAPLATTTPTPEPVCFTPEEQAYFDKLAETTKPSIAANNEHVTLMRMAVDNPAVTLDVGWQHDVVATLEDMRPPIDAIEALSVPAPVQDIHDDYVRVFKHSDNAITLMIDGYRWDSIYKIELGQRMMNEATTGLKSANDKKEARCLQRFFEQIAEESK